MVTSVNTIATLNSAIAAADAATSGTVTIDITGTIALGSTALEAIDLHSGVTLDIVGGGYTLDGGGTQRGLFVYAGTVDISSLTLANMTAKGGAGGGGGAGAGGGGGGGAGLGGGLFVGAAVAGDAGNVTLSGVSFSGDKAIGGSSGSGNAKQAGGGGGGLGTAGASTTNNTGGTGGGVGLNGAPGGGGVGGPIVTPGSTGGFGGGGGGGGAGTNGTAIGRPGGSGGFGGGGGGGGNYSHGGGGGFGGGGGGGGGGKGTSLGGGGGFGGGTGANGVYNGKGGGGGGGLGAGGDIFLMTGASLTIAGASTAAAGTVIGGTGGTGSTNATNGSAYGSGIFIGSNTTAGQPLNTALTLAPGAGQTETIAGVIADEAGSGGSGYQDGTGSLVLNGAGILVLSAVNTYTGGTILDAGTLVLAALAATGSGAITFAGAASLDFVKADVPIKQINGFAVGDKIDVTDLTTTAGPATANGSGILTVGSISLNFGTAFAGKVFQLSSDGASGTDIACYCQGTLILTDRGEVPVEDLRIGDRLVTRSGAVRPLRWMGRRSYVGFFANANRGVLPVRFAAGSLGDGVPRRDLWVSPLHAMFLDDVLIPAAALVNGISITQVERVERVDYIHLELDTHDVIVAEGALSETFVDDAGRGMFHNAYEYHALYPDASRGLARYCAPRVEDGEELEVVRRRLAARAHGEADGPAAGPLQGRVLHGSPRTLDVVRMPSSAPAARPVWQGNVDLVAPRHSGAKSGIRAAR